MPVFSHEIDLHGLSGAIFWMIMIALIFYVIGFATVGWVIQGNMSIGLWMTCSNSSAYSDDWFKAVQAMISIGLAFLIIAALCIFLYMFVHSDSISKTTLIKIITVICFIAVISMLIGIIIFGVKMKNGLNWSFAFAIIGMIFTLLAGILSIAQMKKANII